MVSALLQMLDAIHKRVFTQPLFSLITENQENGIEICVSYMKRVTSPGSMHDTGCLGLVHWDDIGLAWRLPWTEEPDGL